MGKSMEVDVYQRLGKKIDGLTIRTPWKETFHGILKEFYTAKEEEAVVIMPYTFSQLRRIAKRTGIKELRLKNILLGSGQPVHSVLPLPEYLPAESHQLLMAVRQHRNFRCTTRSLAVSSAM